MEENMQPTEELVEAAAAPVEEAVQEAAAPIEEAVQSVEAPAAEAKKEAPKKEEPKKAPKQKKKWTKGKIIGLIIAGIVLTFVLVLCVALVVVGTVGKKALEENPELAEQIQEQIAEQTGEAAEEPVEEDAESAVDMDDIMKGGSYSFTDKSLTDEYYDKVVATVGEHELTCGMFQIFYWTQYQTFVSQYGDYISYLGLDVSKPLSEQNYGEEVTWEQHFVEQAYDYYRQYCALYDEGKAKGVTLPDNAQNTLDNLRETMEANVGNYGYADVEDYLAANYGPGVTFEDYQQYYDLYMHAMAYASEVEASIDTSEEAILAYWNENAEAYAEEGIERVDQNMVNVRHILIMPDPDIDSDDDAELDTSSDEAWELAKQQAEEIYEEWKKDPTEDNFSQLAMDKSHDTGSSSNGGLYENVFPGEMVMEFNDWCFDQARKPGDTDIVKTSYGYHIMYFSSTGDDSYWHSRAKSDCVEDEFYDALDEIFQRYELKPNYDNLHVYDLLYVSMQEQAAMAEAAAALAGEGAEEAEEVPAE